MPRQLSHGAIRDLLGTALNAAVGAGYRAYVRDVFPDSVIYDKDPRGDAIQTEASATYQRAYSIDAKTFAVTLGDASAVQSVQTWEAVAPATFSMATATREIGADGFVTRKGPVFRVGEFPEKFFSLSAAEADAAITAGFAVPNDLEHIATAITHDADGNPRPDSPLGTTRLTHRADDVLFGEVRVPGWLDHLAGDEPLRVSATWNRATKALEGMAICLNPHITGAAVFAAFKASPASRKGPTMEKPTLLQRLLAKFSTASDAEIEEVLKTEPAKAEVAQATDPEIERLKAENARLATALSDKTDARASAAEGDLEKAAADFAKDAVKRGKYTPAEESGVAERFVRFARIGSGETGRVTFANGALVEGDALKEFKAYVDARPTRDYTKELMPGDSNALFAVTGAVPPTDKAPKIDAKEAYDRLNGKKTS